ncbi:MAG TPA: hypothetical protein VGN20_03950 [Mucilaginibacter sp.]|jgi:hypothetical protein
MEKDIALQLLVNLWWFGAGVILCYLFTANKVYILAYLQPMMLNNIVEADRPFKNYFLGFFYIVWKKPILQNSIYRYLFDYKSEAWVILGNKPIKRRLKVLDGLTEFLKPYLILSLLLLPLEYWIRTRFLFDGLTITLKEVQLSIDDLGKLEFFIFLKEHKLIILLLYGLFCLAIPFLYEHKDTTDRVKKWFSRGLVYASILLNISFFGIGLGADVADKTQGLSDVGVQILHIHNQIYRKAMVMVVKQHLRKIAKDHDAALQKEADRINNTNPSKDSRDTLNPIFRFKLEKRLATLADTLRGKMLDSQPDPLFVQIKANLDLVAPAPIQDIANYARDNRGIYQAEVDPLNTYYSQRLKPKQPNAKYEGYYYRKDKWNKKDGEAILSALTTLDKEPEKETSQWDAKFENAAEILVDFGFDAGPEMVAKLIGFEIPGTLGAIIDAFFNSGVKQCLAERFTDLIAAIRTPRVSLRTVLHLTCNSEFNESAPEQKMTADNNKAIKLAIDEIVRQQRAQKAEDKKNAELAREQKREEIARLNEEKKFRRSNLELTNKIEQEIRSKSIGTLSADAAAKAFKQDPRNVLSDLYDVSDLSLQKIFRTKMRQADVDDRPAIESSLRNYLIPDRSGQSAKEYNLLLGKNYRLISSVSNISGFAMKLKESGNIKESEFKIAFPQICWCCGRPLSYPICGCSIPVP